MNDNVENLILQRLDKMREDSAALRDEIASLRKETKQEMAELRNMIGGQGVILTSIAGYIHQVEERVDALEGAEEE